MPSPYRRSVRGMEAQMLAGKVAIAPGATLTPVHYANLEGKQPGGNKMLKFGNKYCNWGLPETEPVDQAYACLYLASKMGRCVKGQLLQVYNGAFL